MKYYLSICSIFRNEAPYMREWIEFHRLMGVEHFFLYNNLSDDNYIEVLEEYIENGIVTLRDWPEPWGKGIQPRMYGQCLEQDGSKCRWIAFIDLDEFLFAPGSGSLQATLKDFESFPGVVVNWQNYGSSGYKNKPDGLVIERFTMKAKTDWIRNRHVKSIVDPAKVQSTLGAHVFIYRNGESAVTENYEPVKVVKSWDPVRRMKRLLIGILPDMPLDPYAIYNCSVKSVSVNKLRINHYVVKSEEEALEFLKHHSHDKNLNRVDRFRYHDRNDVRDDILHAYVPELKKRLSDTGVS